MRRNIDPFSFEIHAAEIALIEGMDRGDGITRATSHPQFLGLESVRHTVTKLCIRRLIVGV